MGESKPALLAKYPNATQQALVNAESLKSTDFVVLQALVFAAFFRRPLALICILER